MLGRLFAFICQSRIIGKPVLLHNAKKRLFQIGVNKVETVARTRLQIMDLRINHAC